MRRVWRAGARDGSLILGEAVDSERERIFQGSCDRTDAGLASRNTERTGGEANGVSVASGEFVVKVRSRRRNEAVRLLWSERGRLSGASG